MFCITAFHALILSGSLIDTAYFETFGEGLISRGSIKSIPDGLFIFIYSVIHLFAGAIAALVVWYLSKIILGQKAK